MADSRNRPVGDEGCDETLLAALNRVGFIVMRERPEESLMTVAKSLGRPAPEPRDGVTIKAIRPTASMDAVKNTLSRRYGTGAFPQHTEAAYWETPPRFLLLYCRNPGEGNRATQLVDSRPLLRTPDATLLRTEPWIVRSGINSFLSSIVSGSGTKRFFRFDGDCMRPAIPSARSNTVLNSFLAEVRTIAVNWRVGDLLIIDNHRVLHGRAEAMVPDPGRELVKVLVNR